MTRVALVTGGNTGIGYATVKGLCKNFDGDVVLTALTAESAEKAVVQLKSEGFEAKGVQLDQTDSSSVDALKAYLESNYGGVDALICNAGTNYKNALKQLGLSESDKVIYEAAKLVIDVNFKGTIAVLTSLNKLMRPSCRIAVLSSRAYGYALRQATKEMQERMRSPDLKTPDLVTAVNRYLEDVKSGDYASKGWPTEVGYSFPLTSMVLAKMASHIQQEMDKAGRENIIVNACCPGMVATAFTDFKGCPPEKGAESSIYLATLPSDAKEPRGKFVVDQKAVEFEELLKMGPVAGRS